MRANTGPMDLSYLLKRRRVAFDRWCMEHGITTKEHFETVKNSIEAHGEFFLGEEMLKQGQALPEQALPGKSVEEPVSVATPTEEAPIEASEEVPALAAEPSAETGKKTRKKV